MPLSSQEAAQSLSQAENARRRSAELYVYHRSSPHLIMWGIIWVIGYGGTGLAPEYSDPLWAGLMLLGVAGGITIGRYTPKDTVTGGFRAWRLVALITLAVFFVFATYAIMQPHLAKQLCAFPALITGSVYAGVGLWAGIRYVVAGIAVLALTMFGFFYLTPHLYFFWMALVGGGAMILAGLWFRTV